MTPKYKRILLKLSGEALMGEDPFGINRQTIESIVAEIAGIDGRPGARAPSHGDAGTSAGAAYTVASCSSRLSGSFMSDVML